MDTNLSLLISSEKCWDSKPFRQGPEYPSLHVHESPMALQHFMPPNLALIRLLMPQAGYHFQKWNSFSECANIDQIRTANLYLMDRMPEESNPELMVLNTRPLSKQLQMTSASRLCCQLLKIKVEISAAAKIMNFLFSWERTLSPIFTKKWFSPPLLFSLKKYDVEIWFGITSPLFHREMKGEGKSVSLRKFHPEMI